MNEPWQKLAIAGLILSVIIILSAIITAWIGEFYFYEDYKAVNTTSTNIKSFLEFSVNSECNVPHIIQPEDKSYHYIITKECVK